MRMENRHLLPIGCPYGSITSLKTERGEARERLIVRLLCFILTLKSREANVENM